MSPALSWLLVFTVVGGFIAIFWQILAWVDRLLDRGNEWRRRR